MTASRIAALTVDDVNRELLRRSRHVSVIHFCHTSGELVDACRTSDVQLVTIGIAGAAQGALLEAVRTIRAEFPAVPVVGLCRPTGRAGWNPSRWIQSGITDLALVGHDDVSAVIDRYLKSGAYPRHAAFVWRMMQSRADEVVRQTLYQIFKGMGRNLSVDDLARSLGITRKTLAARLRERGWPTPKALITWCQVLVAMRLIECTKASLDAVARQVGLSSAGALRTSMRRLIGVTPRLAKSFPWSVAFKRFLHAVEPSARHRR